MPMQRPAAMPQPSEPARGHGQPVPLSLVAIGVPLLVAGVDGPERDELEREGLLPGCVVVVMARTPLGGPVVVELGRTRIALSAAVAAGITTVSVAHPMPA
jgi:Fe2+ transport system protein FeoA